MLQKKWSMLAAVLMSAALCGTAKEVEHKHGVLVGAVTDISSATKTMTVKAADGGEHAFAFAAHTTVHGSEHASKGAEGAFKGLEKGSTVAVHYTAEGGKETADEVDKIGDDGLKAVKVTAVHVGKGGKFVSVETADGAKETFKMTERASEELGKEAAKAGNGTARGTAWVADESGRKVIHFFERAM